MFYMFSIQLLHIGSQEKDSSPPSYHSPRASTEASPDNSVLQNDTEGLDNKAFVPDTQVNYMKFENFISSY